MTARILVVVGALLIVAGIIGFLAAAVALATADKVPNIQTPEGVELTLPEDAPQFVEQRRQAEIVLFVSLLCGGAGLLLVVVQYYLRRRQ